MEIKRGQVFQTLVRLPKRDKSAVPGETYLKEKIAVALQGGPAFVTADDVSVVLISTDRRNGRPLRTHEVQVGVPEGLDHESIIDCRWVFVLPKDSLFGKDSGIQLPERIMADVSRALFFGLNMRP